MGKNKGKKKGNQDSESGGGTSQPSTSTQQQQSPQQQQQRQQQQSPQQQQQPGGQGIYGGPPRVAAFGQSPEHQGASPVQAGGRGRGRGRGRREEHQQPLQHPQQEQQRPPPGFGQQHQEYSPTARAGGPIGREQPPEHQGASPVQAGGRGGGRGRGRREQHQQPQQQRQEYSPTARAGDYGGQQSPPVLGQHAGGPIGREQPPEYQGASPVEAGGRGRGRGRGRREQHQQPQQYPQLEQPHQPGGGGSVEQQRPPPGFGQQRQEYSPTAGAGGQRPQQPREQGPRQATPQQHSPSPVASPPPREATSVASITKQTGLIELSVIPRRLAPKRPPKEGRGRRIQVETNHLDLRFNPNTIVYHYDVTVKPERPIKFFRVAVNEVQKQYYPNIFPAFDGRKNLYSNVELPLIGGMIVASDIEIFDSEKRCGRKMQVEIKLANTLSFSVLEKYLQSGSSMALPQDAIQALDIVLRNPAANRFVQVGRSFFSPPKGQIVDLGGGVTLWYGFFQSAILGWKPFLNVDVAHKGFPIGGDCIGLVKEITGEEVVPGRKLDGRSLSNFEAFIKNLRVLYVIKKPNGDMKRTYRINGICNCPRENIFKNDEGQLRSVEEYFRSHHGVVLKFPLAPCLAVGISNKTLALPLELCSVIEGQVSNKKLNDSQTRSMVRAAAVPTYIRKRNIENSLHQVDYNRDNCMRQFGVSVNTQFTKVDARILDPPELQYNERSPQRVDRGVWRSGRFLKSNPLKNWAILCTDSYIRMDALKGLALQLTKIGGQLGMLIQEPQIESTRGNRGDEMLINDLLTKWRKEKYELVIIILQERRGVSYAKIKQIAEQKIGILTQCLKSSTLNKLSPATVTNILLKINSKHNGINHNITCSIWKKYFQRPVIVFGADVTHPGAGQCGVPSVAAVAASYDPNAFRYNMEWRFQQPKEELIQDLQAIVKKQLLAFYSHNQKVKPEKIFFFRDGVSEGQFKQVLDVELQAIKRACTSLQSDYNPPITFLVVQKRHHTRFFPNERDADGKNKNVPAGTVVDTMITHKNEIDFYLVSHASIQGTARPTKYHVLWDDSNMSEDDIEELTYYLCHLFTRCTRTVSYPAPTYYSHLAAFRIRSYYEEKRALDLDRLPLEQEQNKVVEDFVRNSPMYFI